MADRPRRTANGKSLGKEFTLKSLPTKSKNDNKTVALGSSARREAVVTRVLQPARDRARLSPCCQEALAAQLPVP